jgi:hypothetical protein
MISKTQSFVLHNNSYCHLGDTGVDGRIIIKRIFRKCDVGVWTGSSWFRIRIGVGVNVVMNLRVP